MRELPSREESQIGRFHEVQTDGIFVEVTGLLQMLENRYRIEGFAADSVWLNLASRGTDLLLQQSDGKKVLEDFQVF